MKILRVLSVLLVTATSAVSADTEEPEWTLLHSFGDVEIRSYNPVVQARTTLDNSGQTGTGFKILAGYIFGGNAGEQSIAMTAPVEETLETDSPRMAFTMPRGYDMDTLPAPTDSRVSLHEVPGRTVAAIRFSGWATAGKIQRNKQQLMASLSELHIETVGLPSLNQYNPPWTPPFLRRNEIMVEVSPTTMALP
jgi:SOUL heme-binding protein